MNVPKESLPPPPSPSPSPPPPPQQQQPQQQPPTTPLTTDALTSSSSWSCFVSRTFDHQQQHSQLSGSATRMIIHTVPPRPISKTLGRPRRRTSTQDHATLEKVYLKNHKPNKATRAEIAQKVSMNDREVQIWFQNRRQNDRRKAKNILSRSRTSDLSKRPLAPRPDESSSAAETLTSGSDAAIHESQILSSPSIQGSAVSLSTPDQSSRENEAFATVPPATSIEDTHGNSQPATNYIQRSGTLVSTTTTEQMTPIDNLNQNQLPKRQFGRNQIADQFGNTPSHPFAFPRSPALRISFSPDGEAMVRGPNEPSPVASPVNPTGAIRISMSADGKACVREESEDSPTKPSRNFINSASAGVTNGNIDEGSDNVIQVVAAPKGYAARPLLRRSASALTLNNLKEKEEEEKAMTTPLLSFGRSRDSKLWEMYCDHDIRSTISMAPITQQQNHPHSHHQRIQSQLASPSTPTPATTSRTPKPRGGRKKLQRASTINTASLLKRRALAPRNGNNQDPAVSVEGPNKKRSRLSRASSSLARLENTNSNSLMSNKTVTNSMKPSRRGQDSDFLQYSGGDSDKENWEPGFRIGSSLSLSSSSYHAARNDSRGATYDRFPHLPRHKEDAEDAEEEEVGEPDGGDTHRQVSQSSRTSEPADLDCIQGLLSLSQGAWR